MKKRPVKRKKATKKRSRKIKYPRKRKNISKRQAKKAVRKVMKKKKMTKKRKPIVKRIRPIQRKEKIKHPEKISAPVKKGGSMEQTMINSTGEKKEEMPTKVQATALPPEKELKDPEKMPLKVTNVLNVAKYVKDNTKKNVSPGFIYELISRLRDEIDLVLHDSEIIANGENRKTLMEIHVIHAYSYRHPDRHRVIGCSNCEHSFSIDVSDVPSNNDAANHPLICPFCGQKRSLVFTNEKT